MIVIFIQLGLSDNLYLQQEKISSVMNIEVV